VVGVGFDVFAVVVVVGAAVAAAAAGGLAIGDAVGVCASKLIAKPMKQIQRRIDFFILVF